MDFKKSDLFYYRRYLLTTLPLVAALLVMIAVLALVKDPLLPYQKLLLVILLLLGVFGTIRMAAYQLRIMLRPLTLLARAMRRFQAGSANVRVREVSDGEMGELQRGFNRMVREIGTVNERLQQEVTETTKELQETNEELEIRNAQLDIARRRAIEANRVKSDFLASMSHEIRTPMNGIIGFAELLSGTELDQQQQEYTHTIRRSAECLMRLIDDILDYASLESSEIKLRHEPFQVRDTVDSALHLIAPSAHQKGLELVGLVYQDVPEVLVGDEPRIIQILTSLLSNGVKFTAEGEVILRVMIDDQSEHGVRLGLSVSDTGIGLSDEEAETLMEAFARGAQASKSAEGGTGLGLAMCQALAHAMDGSVTVSGRPGEGAVFYVEVALERSPEPAELPSPGISGRNRPVLLVESHGLSAIVLRNDLETLGFEVEHREQLQEFEVSELADYALVILSANAGNMEVAQLQRLIRAFVERGVPSVALVNSSDQLLMQRLREAGAAAGSRPVARQRFWALLRNAIKRRAAPSLERRHRPRDTPSAGIASPPKTKLEGLTCVAADDNEINRTLLTHLLRDGGAEVLEAEDGEQAVQHCRAHQVDVAILDIHMPRMNGLAAASAIRECSVDTALIALTADAADATQVQIMQGEFDARLVKPVSGGMLVETILETLRGDSHLEELKLPEPEPAATSDLAVYDAETALRVSGSERVGRQLLESLAKELPDAVTCLVSALEQQDWEALWQEAHRLKGSAAICGATALQAALSDLETGSNHRDEAAAGLALARTQLESNRLIAFSKAQAG